MLRRRAASPPTVRGSLLSATLHAGASGRFRAHARVRGALGLGVLALALAIGAPAAYGATISVNTTADELNADGDCSLREAIQAANTNATVDACPAGEPAPTVDVITFGVTGTITLGSMLPNISEPLTIDGPGAASLTISGGGTVRVLEVGFFFPSGAALDLKDVTVANGSAGFPFGGAGIRNHGTLTVTDSTFSGNVATDSDGGGINNLFGATLTVADSTFTGNTADGTGAGIANNGGNAHVSHSAFTENSADGGGGVDTNTGTTTVTNSTFSGNSARVGGAIIMSNGTITVTDSTFSENSANAGGGIFAEGGTTTVTGSTFSMNDAVGFGSGQGGGIINNATLDVANSTFSANSSGGNGGAIQNNGASTVTNSTISGNSSVGFGGGIRSLGTLTLKNTIVANNSGDNCGGGGFTDGGGNLSWSDTTCPGINQDPLLDPAGLQNNGGPTQTIALQPGSPAIDAAAACPPPMTDQRGVSRPQGPACDIGAFELVTNHPPSCASVVASPNRLWPPNHMLRLITLSGATDPDGDTVTLTITGVTQDEPVSGLGGGDLSPDARAGAQSNTVFVRAERSDRGDGRVYRIAFTGADGNGGTCSGTATVGVPKTVRSTPVDSAPPSYNSFGP